MQTPVLPRSGQTLPRWRALALSLTAQAYASASRGRRPRFVIVALLEQIVPRPLQSLRNASYCFFQGLYRKLLLKARAPI